MAKKTLVVYYSYGGNTERIAKMVQKATGGDLTQIETVEPYTGSYDAVVQQGQEEVESGYKPGIRPLDVDMEAYDTILIGTPTWWYTMAPAVLTFLSSQDWHGKTVIPFMTNAGWPGHVIEDMKQTCTGANFICEKEFEFDPDGSGRLITAESEVKEWMAAVKRAVS